ncbi:acyl-CoA carboxylase subunit epsilon [Actinacidiphila yeochonensis]|uniref:acyl-CoA carboxylase subunit epsilon n=1 Tax=Actinacidiphila yeochonensis TaxID=89050 RepID=UPI00056B5E34|nr:acyl-CoA carboxylase subunit epsilon [Actinacidiphila yeochonensis]
MDIKVERGWPTPEELAAVVALVRARAMALAQDDGPAPEHRSAWSDPARTVPGAPRRPGPDAWRTSAWRA